MCIRDRPLTSPALAEVIAGLSGRDYLYFYDAVSPIVQAETCLLYTSDAADERSSVDLGGRRIIKKKNTEGNRGGQ